jgi:hypothetical protein
MKLCTVRNLVSLSLLIATLAALQACSPINSFPTKGVAEAYNSSGTVIVPPYTRSVFNTNNF